MIDSGPAGAIIACDKYLAEHLAIGIYADVLAKHSSGFALFWQPTENLFGLLKKKVEETLSR
jgi:hypothetical protein